MGFKWKVSPTHGYDAGRYIRALDKALGDLLGLYWAPRLETDAKQQASWTDRTGNARQTLAAYAVKLPKRGSVEAVYISDGEALLPADYDPGVAGWAIILRHGMSYGKNLELNYGGRYAIVLPTLQNNQRAIWDSVRGLVQ